MLGSWVRAPSGSQKAARNCGLFSFWGENPSSSLLHRAERVYQVPDPWHSSSPKRITQICESTASTSLGAVFFIAHIPPAIHLGQGTLLQHIILTVSAPGAANWVVPGAYTPLTSTPEPHPRTRCFARAVSPKLAYHTWPIKTKSPKRGYWRGKGICTTHQ